MVGGRSGAYEEELRQAKQIAIDEMVGVDLDYETIGVGSNGNTLMVSTSGTAVVVE